MKARKAFCKHAKYEYFEIPHGFSLTYQSLWTFKKCLKLIYYNIYNIYTGRSFQWCLILISGMRKSTRCTSTYIQKYFSLNAYASIVTEVLCLLIYDFIFHNKSQFPNLIKFRARLTG